LKQALLFVNKKKQKNFDFFDVTSAGATQARSGAKVFLVLFFQKKNCFLKIIGIPRAAAFGPTRSNKSADRMVSRCWSEASVSHAERYHRQRCHFDAYAEHYHQRLRQY